MTNETNVFKMRSPSSLETLKEMIDYMFEKPSELRMVEIGCYTGESTEVFAKNFQKVYGIDPWEKTSTYEGISAESDFSEVERIFDNNIILIYDSVVKIKGLSEVEHKIFEDESLDFVYIDGNHTFESVLQDITLWYPKIKVNGYIGGHDYYRVNNTVKNAILEYFKKDADKIFEDSSWVIKKV